MEPWYDKEWIDGVQFGALACPQEEPIGTIFYIDGSRWGLADGLWICHDRGGRIVIGDNGVYQLDLLTTHPVWRETIPVVLARPVERGCGEYEEDWRLLETGRFYGPR